ncbi:hypothetical protein K443DRAFT_110126 [Laccaria amethystina LaAM-08-1]|uniref:Unplaced genomic scaffold K443scaffold_250, whole genome shotgun sequence n=1 Tax=Laccaria amethystina LaAM-08-1 TaxID=1095629 RepID=A0A0C9X027_9AGAR|nr:hypothetical protein K443DRAFT_110126 [Laccaria amethystina LaAM-08-1]
MLSSFLRRTVPPSRSITSSFPPSKFQRRTWTTVTTTSNALTIHKLNNTSFPYIWLRDSCQSPECIHPSTKQKLHRTSDVPLSIAPVMEGGVQVTKDGIAMTWTDGHKSFFDANFLERHAFPTKLAESHHDHCIMHEAWTNKSISECRDLFIPYETIHRLPRRYRGVVTHLPNACLQFVSGLNCGIPSSRSTTSSFLPSKFQRRSWTTITTTSDALTIHNLNNTSFPYIWLRDSCQSPECIHPSTKQKLHYTSDVPLSIAPVTEGGTSIFVDSLHAARVLRDTHPNDFGILTKTPVAFHYINDGHHLHHNHPTIELAPLSTLSSPSSQLEISHVNYSPQFQAPLPLSTPREFYPALKRFAKLLNDPQNTYEYTLREGDAVLFDNRHVLHARTAFSDPESELGKGETNRWLKGCYLEADALVDRMRVLRAKIVKGLI